MTYPPKGGGGKDIILFNDLAWRILSWDASRIKETLLAELPVLTGENIGKRRKDFSYLYLESP